MSWNNLKERLSQKGSLDSNLKIKTSKEEIRETINGQDKPKVKRYRNKFMKQYPELYRSDVSIHPSYTGLKTLPYYVIARRRVHKTRKQINRQLNREITHMALMQAYALGGVRVDRTFSIGFPPEASKIPDFATDKERRRINDLGRLSILYSCGKNPLELWDSNVKNGYIRRVTDEEVNSLALEIAGTNVSTTYIISPKDPQKSLGICLPFLIMIIKNMKRYFTFEITILDDQNMHRRFRASNFQSVTRVRPFSTTMPIGLSPGWNQIQFNLADFTRRAYGTNYVETTRMQVHANCRIRRIYFSDKLYNEAELPEEYRLLFPFRKVIAEEKKEEIPEQISKTSMSRLSRGSYELRETYGEESIDESLESRVAATVEETTRLSIHVPLGDYEGESGGESEGEDEMKIKEEPEDITGEIGDGEEEEEEKPVEGEEMKKEEMEGEEKGEEIEEEDVLEGENQE